MKMEGKNVEMFLKTPLFRFKYLVENKEEQLIENAVRMKGSVVSEKPMGLVIKVKDLSNQRQKQEFLPFESVFIPYDKIDFIIFV